MSRSASSRSLNPLLRAVSRSFFLTLRAAPRSLRRQLGTAYLFCRAADTIADTSVLPRDERLEHLRTYRAQFAADEPREKDLERIAGRLGRPSAVAGERELLERLEECFAVYRSFDEGDRRLVRRLVTTLTRGMEMDLERFPPEDSGQVAALSTDGELDLYCYHVAGCVGEFWTDLQLRHLPALKSWDADAFRRKGVRFGKGLQLTNILRDVDRDLAIGRCYLPETRLGGVGLSCEVLASSRDRSAVRPLVHDLIRATLDHYSAGWEFALAIPRRLGTLRLACVWPLWIGLRTLALLAGAEDPAAPGVVLKIPRSEVYRLMLGSALRFPSNRLLDRYYRALQREVEILLDAPKRSAVTR